MAILFNGVEQFGNFGRGLAKEHFCEIIPKSVHLFSRGSCLKLFSIYSPGGHLVQQRRNGLSNFGGQSPKEHTCIIFFKIDALVKEEKSIEGFLFLALAAILFSVAESFEQFW